MSLDEIEVVASLNLRCARIPYRLIHPEIPCYQDPAVMTAPAGAIEYHLVGGPNDQCPPSGGAGAPPVSP